jgi:hypothetical protein
MRYYLQNSSGRLELAGQLPVFGSGQLDLGVDKIAVGDVDSDGGNDAVILQQSTLKIHILHGRSTSPSIAVSTIEDVVSARTNQRVRYRVRVTNTDDRRSSEIRLSWSLPAAFSASTLVGAKGACYLEAGQGVCMLPQLDAAGYVDVMLTGSYAQNGTQQLTVGATSGSATAQQILTSSVAEGGSSGGGGSGGGGSSGGDAGGGGQGDLLTLAFLAALVAAAMRRRRARSLATTLPCMAPCRL